MRTRTKPHLYDVVRLTRDVPEQGLIAGSVGTIVTMFDQPEVAYEIEFCDHEGRTIAELALKGDAFQVIGV